MLYCIPNSLKLKILNYWTKYKSLKITLKCEKKMIKETTY